MRMIYQNYINWLGSYLSDILESIWTGLQGLLALILFPILFVYNTIEMIVGDLTCKIGYHHYHRFYCKYCGKKEKDE